MLDTYRAVKSIQLGSCKKFFDRPAASVGEKIRDYKENLNSPLITSYERDNETDLDFAQARMYQSQLGRFTSPDDSLNDTHTTDPSSWNLYVYVRNNPLRYIDPSGMVAGDFYDLEGNHIGSDENKTDGKIYIVYDKDEAKKIKITKGDYKETVNSKITLPSVDVVTGMNEAVKRSDAATFDKSGFTLEKNQTENGGGFREAGITWDKDGKVTVEPDGPYNDPRIDDAGMVLTPNTEGSGHVHPSGVITTRTRGIFKDEAGNIGPGTNEDRDYIKNVPSQDDYTNAARGANIMIGGYGKERTATFYTKNGVVATMKYEHFTKLGAKRK